MAKERLSKLQKWILAEALKRGELWRKDIYRDFYGIRAPGSGSYMVLEPHEKQKSNRAYPAVTQSTRRLKEKRLVKFIQKGWTGQEAWYFGKPTVLGYDESHIVLTDAGIKTAKKLVCTTKP